MSSEFSQVFWQTSDYITECQPSYSDSPYTTPLIKTDFGVGVCTGTWYLHDMQIQLRVVAIKTLYMFVKYSQE